MATTVFVMMPDESLSMKEQIERWSSRHGIPSEVMNEVSCCILFGSDDCVTETKLPPKLMATNMWLDFLRVNAPTSTTHITSAATTEWLAEELLPGAPRGVDFFSISMDEDIAIAIAIEHETGRFVTKAVSASRLQQ